MLPSAFIVMIGAKAPVIKGIRLPFLREDAPAPACSRDAFRCTGKSRVASAQCHSSLTDVTGKGSTSTVLWPGLRLPVTSTR